jgi:hypothetical protein
MTNLLDKLHRNMVRAGIDPYTGNALEAREAEKARIRNEETKKVPVEEWAEKLAGDLAKFKD